MNKNAIDQPKEVREGEGLDIAALKQYLNDHLEKGINRLEIQQFPSGYSNLTYLLKVDEEEYERLYLLADPVAELLKSHSEHDDFAVTHLIQPGIDHQIDLAFQTFGASMLSPREKDVLELMLRGYGTDVSAQRLGIALETVRRHRKSIYRKLDVSSQTDLFSLFINSMSCLGEAGGADPLSIYMAPSSAH